MVLTIIFSQSKCLKRVEAQFYAENIYIGSRPKDGILKKLVGLLNVKDYFFSFISLQEKINYTRCVVGVEIPEKA